MASLEPVVLYKLDTEKGEGIELAKEFKIKGYPTFVILNDKGQTVDRWIGYTKEYLLATMESAMMDLTPIQEKMFRFETDPNLNDALVLGRYSRSLGEYEDAVKYYRAAQKINEDPDKDYLYEIFSNTADGALKDMFTFEDAGNAADAVLASAATDADDKYGVASKMTHLAEKKEKLDLVTPYLEAGIEALKGSEDPDDARNYATLMADYSLYVTKDHDKAVSYKKKTMPEGWQENAGNLNSFCWWCFENKVNLEEAEELSRKSVKLAEPGEEKAMYLDTLSEICNALGKLYEAVEFMKIAVREAPDNEYYKEQLERFEKLLASKN
ncbi:MAG: thioredoxin family protein [Candidatus Zixiibacteriota bacterium]|nr:MAG: thioredoxin family protein [candidate division Zixibacteria bacterium]